MDSDRLGRGLLGAAVFLLALLFFEPSLFSVNLPEAVTKAELFRDLVGVVGAVCGLVMIVHAIKPLPKPTPASSYWETQAAPATPLPEAAAAPVLQAELSSEAEPKPAEEPAEPAWGSYVAPDEHIVAAARSLVEIDHAEEKAKASPNTGLPHPPPRVEPPKPDQA